MVCFSLLFSSLVKCVPLAEHMAWRKKGYQRQPLPMNDELDQSLPTLGKELERWMMMVAESPYFRHSLAIEIQHPPACWQKQRWRIMRTQYIGT